MMCDTSIIDIQYSVVWILSTVLWHESRSIVGLSNDISGWVPEWYWGLEAVICQYSVCMGSIHLSPCHPITFSSVRLARLFSFFYPVACIHFRVSAVYLSPSFLCLTFYSLSQIIHPMQLLISFQNTSLHSISPAPNVLANSCIILTQHTLIH